MTDEELEWGYVAITRGRYKGRIGLHELLLISDEIKKLIHTRGTVTDLFKVARAQEMTTLVQDGVLKVLQGWTDYAQVKAAATR